MIRKFFNFLLKNIKRLFAVYSMSIVLTSGYSFAAGRSCNEALIGTPPSYFRLAISDFPAPVFEIESFKNLMVTIRDLLKQQNYTGNRVLIRIFRTERLETFLATGSDRDKDSKFWDSKSLDASKEDRHAAGIENTQVTYASTVDISKNPAMVVRWTSSKRIWPPLSKKSWENYYEEQYETYNAKFPYTIAVYNPSKLIRASEVEYWFKVDPKEALLMTLIRKISK